MLYTQKMFITLTKTRWLPAGCAVCLSPHKEKMAALPAPSTMCLFPDNDTLVRVSHRWISPSLSPRQWKTMMDKPLKAKLFMLHCAATVALGSAPLSWVLPRFFFPAAASHTSTATSSYFTGGCRLHLLLVRTPSQSCTWGMGRGWVTVVEDGVNPVAEDGVNPIHHPCDEERDVTSQGCLLFIIYGQWI